MGGPFLSGARIHRLLLAGLLWLCCAQAWGADIYVVANDVTLSSGDIREVYLGEKEFSGNVRLVPIDNESVQAEFVTKALSMSPQRYTALWVRKAFRDALNPPALKATDADVIAFVKQTRGAVGYISSMPRDKELHVVGKF
jgi:hypothetical protein